MSQQSVKITNPRPGGSTHVSMSHARRYVRRKEARFDNAGRLVFLFDPDVLKRKMRHGPMAMLRVEKLGPDAREGQSVLRQFGKPERSRGPLRPPVLGSGSIFERQRGPVQ